MIGNHGIFPAHDARNADGLFLVADHQHIFIQLPLLAVQCHKFFSGCRPADNDLTARNGIQIVGVHGLSVFFHDVVSDIHQIVDGPNAVGSQASLHPLRRRTDLDVFHNPAQYREHSS